MTAHETQGPNLAELEAAASQATAATQAAADRVTELESQLVEARSRLEAAKAHEMEARRAFAVAKETPASSG